MNAPESRWPSFHPAIVGREEAMASLAASTRRLIDLTVTNDAPPDVLEHLVARLEAINDELTTHVPDGLYPRFVDPDSVDPPVPVDRVEATMHGAMPFDPVIGAFNPIALPVDITFEPPLAIGTACFTTPYEGGPGWVHGAALAATFDIVLTAANQLSEAAGPTVWLTIRFKRPTLVGVEARFEAEVVANDGRRVTSRGRLIQDGIVCVEAEGEFAVISANKLRRQRP